jgi:hypothetical protein
MIEYDLLCKVNQNIHNPNQNIHNPNSLIKTFTTPIVYANPRHRSTAITYSMAGNFALIIVCIFAGLSRNDLKLMTVW